MTGNQVDQRGGDEEGVDFARAVGKNGAGGFFDGGQAADAGTDVDTDAVFVESRAVVKAGVGHGLQGGGDAVVDEAVHAARFFGADVLVDVEIFDFAGNPAGEIGGIKTGNGADAAFAGQQVVPCARDVVAYRRYLPQACDDYSSLIHKCFSV